MGLFLKKFLIVCCFLITINSVRGMQVIPRLHDDFSTSENVVDFLEEAFKHSENLYVLVNKLVSSGRMDFNVKGICGSSILHTLVSRGDEEILKYIIHCSDLCLHVNDRDNSNNTPLHLAVKYSLFSIIDLLLSYGADPNSENLCGQSPLSLAEFMGSSSIKEKLLKFGR